MSSPRISVCVPTYNGESFLDECLAGLAAQTLRDFEVLVVDDSSSDATVSIARRWAERDDRIRIHVNPRNLGLVGNWNRCIELATGEWIKFLFQDDLIAPRCLEVLLRIGAGSGGFVACSRDFLFDDQCDPALRDTFLSHRTVVEKMFGEAPFLSPDAYCREKLDRLDMNIVGEPTAVMIRKDLFGHYGLFDPLMVQICDSEMWTRLASNVGIGFTTERLVTFRVHGGSTSRMNRDRPLKGVILDGIIESYRFCTAPMFEAFRASAQRAGRLEMLKAGLETQINIAFYMLRDSRGEPGSRAIRDDFEAVMNELGGYTKARNRHWWFRFKRMLGLASPVP